MLKGDEKKKFREEIRRAEGPLSDRKEGGRKLYDGPDFPRARDSLKAAPLSSRPTGACLNILMAASQLVRPLSS